MEISLVSDTLTAIATKYGHGLGISNFFTDRHCSSYDHQLQTYALMVAIDAIAPPSVKPRTVPKKLARKRCRVKRRSKTNGGGPYVDEDGGGFFDGGDGPFGGAGGGGGSGGNFDGFNWDESLPASPSDPAFDFVYGVLSWIVFSNCLHFAFKKVFRILADGVSAPEREKVPLRFTPILIRGASGDELKKVKHVVQCGVFAAYHLALETSFLADEGASLPELPLNSPLTVALPDNPSSIDRSISTIPGFIVPLNEKSHNYTKPQRSNSNSLPMSDVFSSIMN